MVLNHVESSYTSQLFLVKFTSFLAPRRDSPPPAPVARLPLAVRHPRAPGGGDHRSRGALGSFWNSGKFGILLISLW
jgi:hypothetical protein